MAVYFLNFSLKMLEELLLKSLKLCHNMRANKYPRSGGKAMKGGRREKERRKKSVNTIASFASTEASWTKKVGENNLKGLLRDRSICEVYL